MQHKKETVNLIEMKKGNNVEWIGVRYIFLNRPQALRSTISKCDLIKLKSFCKTNDINRKKTAAYRMWKYFHQLYIWLRVNFQNIWRNQENCTFISCLLKGSLFSDAHINTQFSCSKFSADYSYFFSHVKTF